ncbi:sterol regulatory element-binding protein site 2 protease, putative [Ricinus communis]|uniref:Sterol regulatory element-binding protein site 2 protease, putative n=1 Tax=Ricinus communis TaxID=3988 RepID=B9S7Z4_RICCO|nr:sterol regulatory element-binding protein site 2 protease, putative [Ricinus communis]|eukprot:XP_002522110.1 probable zinc metallopeptidase EGY3, chloroplastic [Ricinus communis]
MATTLSTTISNSSLSQCSPKHNDKKQNSLGSNLSCSFSFSFSSSNKPRKYVKFITKNEQESEARKRLFISCSPKHSFGQKTRLSSSIVTKENLLPPIKLSAKDEQESDQSSCSVAVVAEKTETETEKSEDSNSKEDKIEKEKQQEMDWKTDEEFKKFMGSPSIEAAIKLEKKRADRKLKELDRESSDNPLVGFFNRLLRDSLAREKERLEMAEEAFKALDLNKLKSCFGFDTFFATDVRRFGDGGIFIGNLRKPIEEVIPKLEKKISEAAGREVVIWFMEERNDNITKQACVVQPKSEMDLQFESTKLSTPWGYISAVALCVTTFGTIALMSGFFLKPDATFDDYIADVVPLFGGFLSILGASEITTRITAARYGVKLSPSFLVPSNWTGCLGVMNNYESLLPNKKALFDIPVARTASAYLTSLVLAIAAFAADGSFNGGDNALYIRPEFFYNNPLLSFIQYVIGPYTDDLGNVLPYAVEGVGVPVDPLAFAGLLGMVVTSLNLLPCGRLEGGRMAQAMFGRSTATLLSFATSLLLGIGGLSGSVLCLAWGLFATFFRGGEELPAKDEITPLGSDRYAWGIVLGLICFLTLFPNGGGTFSSPFFSDPFFRGDL